MGWYFGSCLSLKLRHVYLIINYINAEYFVENLGNFFLRIINLNLIGMAGGTDDFIDFENNKKIHVFLTKILKLYLVKHFL